MKRLIQPLGFSLLMMMFLTSCLKDKNEVETTTITEGSKWGITIGSTPEEVFQALQELDAEKDGKIGYVSYSGQHVFDTPEEIADRYIYYNAISMQSPDPVINRVIIVYDESRVTAIEAGGALTDEVDKWPGDASADLFIQKDDEVETLIQKISAIHHLSEYQSYQIILPEKTLSKDFDPALATMTQWGFSFEDMIAPGKAGANNVSLNFTDGKLTQITVSYMEHKVFN